MRFASIALTTLALIAIAYAFQHTSWEGTWYVQYAKCGNSCCCPQKGDRLRLSQSKRYDDVKLQGGKWKGSGCKDFDWSSEGAYFPWNASHFFSDTHDFSVDENNHDTKVHYEVSLEYDSDDDTQWADIQYTAFGATCKITLLSGPIQKISLALISIVGAIIAFY